HALGGGEGGADGDGLPAGGLDLGDDLVRPRRLLAVVDDDVRSLGGEQLRGRGPDSSGRTGAAGGPAGAGAHRGPVGLRWTGRAGGGGRPAPPASGAGTVRHRPPEPTGACPSCR